jgi:ribonucleoside-diphosphate reductase alpha chain
MDRTLNQGVPFSALSGGLRVTKRDGNSVLLEVEKLKQSLERAAQNAPVSIDLLLSEAVRNIYDNVSTQELESALIMAAVAFIEKDPEYDAIATRLLLQKAYREVFGISIADNDFNHCYRKAFIDGLHVGVKNEVFNAKILEFDLERLAAALMPDRDNCLNYLGLQTLYERYFLKINKKRFELPQTFWMRIAMGLALNEPNKNERAIEFYSVFSTLRYTSSTPTLFHSGYKIAQLSSCYLSTVNDDLGHIFKVIGDNAQLSKWAGGIGNDWTNIRGTGSWIKSIHATSQGVIPYLKIVNDVVVCITRSGIRRGGTCSYIETWHIDIEDFIDLRRNTGDERRRTHDMNTANWIPDLFIKRVMQDADWTLFSPDEVPDLHDLYGRKFEARYLEYEQKAREGKIKLFKTVSALKLWRKMLSRLFETGHPWVTFKDPCNIRSPQDHVGVVHSSNLCTEITLNTSADETAVCNLGSINLSEHIVDGKVDEELMGRTIKTAVRMLDNVIDLNFYPTIEAKNSNERHRPIGLGVMGFQDALFKLNIPFSSPKALEFADRMGEVVSYYAILASSELAKERGTYQTYKGSKWDRNIFPIDTLDLLEQERGMPVEMSRTCSMDWQPVREHVKNYGMRNSNVMAIAPTATIANIAGCYPSIEPIYKNIYVKANITGEFTIVNNYLVEDLKKLSLWNETMLEQLKYYDGDLSRIAGIPQHIKEKYKTAFELDPLWLVKITATRAKWIDQSQSYNVFMQGVSGKTLEEIYITGWKYGLKTFYYLRTLGATQIEKATLDASKYGFTQKREYKELPELKNMNEIQYAAGAVCNPFNNSECESCQ